MQLVRAQRWYKSMQSNMFNVHASRQIQSSLIFAGCILAYTLYYYYTHYPLLKSEWFIDPTSHYPDEDNISAGFYMTTFACVLYFTSAVLNVINIVKLIKDTKNAVIPI